MVATRMCLRSLIVGLVWLWLAMPSAWGQSRMRSAAAPSLGASVNVVPKLAMRLNVEGRFVTSGPRWAHWASLAMRAGPYAQVHPIVGLYANYLFAEGVFPLDGTGNREHAGQIGLRLSSLGERFLIGNSTALDLRGIRTGHRWGFDTRTRSELRLTGVFFPWLKLSTTSEVLVSPSLPSDDRLQLRTGLMLHGDIERPRDLSGASGTSERRAPPGLFWLVGARAGLHPMAMAMRSELPQDAPPERVDRAHTVDLVVHVSLAGLF